MTKFKFNEKEYSLEQVESAAKQSNLGLDEYLTKTGISRIGGDDDDDKKKKKKGVADEGANVTPAENKVPKNTDLKSEGTSSESKNIDPVEPAVDKQSKALIAFENRTGREAKSIMELTDEDYESNIFEDPFSDNSTLVDETKVFVDNRSRLKEIAKQRKDLENKATTYSYNKYGPTLESVDYIKQQLKTFDDDNAYEIENMEFEPGFKLRNDAVNQLSKDTGNYQASGDTMQDLAQEFSVLQVFAGQGSFQGVEATEEIKLKEDVQTAVIEKLDEYQLQKLAGGFYNLQEKENLINEVKIPIVQSRIEDIKKESNLFESRVEQEASDINENQQVILNSIKNLTGGGTQFKKDYNPTEGQVQEYNVLVAEFNKGLSDSKDLQKAYEDRKNKMSDNLSSLEGEYGIDLATGALANNFKLSDDIDKFRESYSGDGFWNGVGDIFVGEFVQGLYQLTKKGAVGTTAWAFTVAPDMLESNDTYSPFDAFTDVVNNWSNSTLVPRSEDKKFNITKEEGGFKEFDGRSYLKLGASMATFTGYLIGEVRKGNFKGIKEAAGKTFANLGNKGKVLAPVSQKLKDDIIMVNAAFQATIMDNVKDAERMGLKGISAQTYGMVNSTAESLFQTIMPDSNFLKGVKGKAIKDAFRGSLKNVANKKAAQAASKQYVTNIFKELGEEELTSGVRLITDASYGLALPNSTEFLNSQLELVAGTFMLSGSLGAAGAKNTFGNQKTLVYNQISKNINSVDKQFQAMYEASNDVEVMEEIKKARQFARDVDKAVRHSPESVNSEQIDLLLEKQKLIKKRESTDSAFFPAIDKKIQETNEKIQESQIKQDIASQFDKDIENIGKSIESTGLKVDETKVFETNENQSADDQMKEFLLDNAPKNIAEQGEDASENWANENKNSYGTFVTTKDGREVLIINKDSALKDSFVTTGQHEFLHKLILSNLGSNKEVISKAGELLLEDLKSLEDGSELKNRVLTYAEALGNNEMSKEQFFEEVLPLYSEALTRKDIDTNKSTLGKAGDFFRQMFQNAGLKKVSFEDAQGVKNFITDYNKSYSKGKFKGAIKNFSDLSKSKNEDQEQESKAAFSKPESVEFIEGKLEELEDKYFDQEIDEYQFEQQREKLEKDLVKAEEAAKIADNKVEAKVEDNIEAEVETETKPVEEVKKVDKIVEEATTEVFEVKEVSDKNKQIAKTNDDIVKEMTDVGANRISEIKDPEAKKAIVDKLGENNIGAVTELAKKAAATSRDLPIDKNLKVGYEEFFLGFSEELSALINSYKANVDGKQVPFGAYMNQNLRLRYGSILDRSLKGKLKGSESLSSDKNIKKEVGSFIEDSSSESTSRDEGRVLEQIDVRKFGPAKDKVDQISNIVEVEEGQRPTYKELTEKFIDPVSMELFEVPGKKIQGKATLTDTEAKSLQRLFVSPDNVRKLIKTMPPYNVAGSETTIGERAENIDVSKDTKGRSIGLSNKFIKQFYQPVTRAIPGISSPKGRSLGETSQGQVYELKPEFKGRVSNEAVKQIQNSVGVTEAGVPNEKISAANRTKYGTTLTGFAKTYIANVINVTGRSKQTSKQEQADTGAGKASIMFSKTAKENNDFSEKFKSNEVKKLVENKFENLIKEAKLPDNIAQEIKNVIGNESLKPIELFQVVSDIASQDLSVNSKRSFQEGLITDLIKSEGKDFGAVLVDNLKKVRKIFKKEYEAIGFVTEVESLKESVKGDNKETRDSKVIDWLLSVSRSVRSSRNKSLLYVSTNKKLFDSVLKDVVGKDSDFEAVQKKLPSGKVVSFIKYKGEGLEGFQDITELKSKGFRVYGEKVSEQADKARELALDKIDSLKDRLNGKEITKGQYDSMVDSYLSLVSLDQKGLIRKMSKPNGEIIDGYRATELYLEHKMSAQEIKELLSSYAEGKVEKQEVLDILEKEALVNIMPKALEKFLPNFAVERAKNPNYKNAQGYESKEYLKALEQYKPFIEDMNGNSVMFSKKQAVDRAKTLDQTFNDIIEKKTGIDSRKRYGIVEAITKGSSKGKFNFFIPPAAEDFVGLLYPTLSKGKVGDAQMSWYKKNLIDPFAEGMNKLSKARVYTTNSYNQLKKQLDIVPKNLTKKVGKTDYTKEQAIRVYIWKKQKMAVPGMNSKDVNMLSNYVAGNSKLQSFADQLINLQLGDGYAKPKVGWPAGTITTDILEGLNTTKRAKYLSKWQQNVDEIFSEDNLNKLQAAYGVNYRKALEGTLKRMQTGRNRNFSGDSTTGRFTDWLTGSVGAIMFFNTRSAVLQTISAANYINFEDNNIFAAGKAFANQKQYWTDFMKLMNSDFLKERRGGLRMNVNEADISDMAKKGGARGVISKLLEFGFTPTQVADSFAIASGGSTFYRNRIKTYKKQGLSEKEAEKKAFEDFREATEESQQSSRADRISQQQASPLGRVVLAFANAPAQYARIMKKAASDLKNGRGSAKANISRIIYYGAIQNLIFNSLQQALFAMSFDDEEPEDKEKEKKYLNVANGMLDSVLRGTGIAGSLVSVGKNTIIKVIKELDKDRPKLQNIALEVAKISPPVSAKLSRLSSAGKSYDWNKQEMIDKGFSLDNPAYLAAGNVVSALTNVPLDRIVKKANNVVQATTQDLETWERIALLGGWQDWELGIKKEKERDQPATKTRYGVPIRRKPTRITIQR